MTEPSTLDPTDTTVSAGSRALRTVVAVAMALALGVSVKGLVLETWFVPNEAMAPTLDPGQRALVLKVGEIDRGDVVVADVSDAFEGPSRATHRDDGLIGRILHAAADALGVRSGARSVAGVVVGVGGDHVECCSDGAVTVNGAPVAPAPADAPTLALVVPSGHVWVLSTGPLRGWDSLSRTNESGRGLIGEDDIVGRVIATVWPPRMIRASHGTEEDR